MSPAIDWSRTRVLVAGGGGFLGSHVVRLLRGRGADPAVPRTKDGWDLRRPESAAELMAKYSPELVIDCAANQGGLAYIAERPAEVFHDNMLLGVHLVRAAQEAGVRSCVSTLAACSYPGELRSVMREEEYWSGPLHESVVAYGFAKKARVVQAECYARQHGMRAPCLLLANLYGPGDHLDPGRSHALTALLRRFFEAARDGLDEVVVWGSGEPVREWLYVGDAAEALVLAAEKLEEVGPFNVGTGVGISIRELAERIAARVGYRGAIRYDRTRPDGAPSKTLAVDRFAAATGWRAGTSLDLGLARSLEWLEGVLRVE
jgi:GDP-L-fucose synthase